MTGNSRPLSKTIDVPADEHRYFSPRIDEPGGYSFDVFVEDGPSGLASFSFGVYELNTGSNVFATVHDDEVGIVIEE